MVRAGSHAAIVVWLALSAGCSWFSGDAAPDDEDALKKEVAALRAELNALQEEVDVAHDVVAQTPSPARSAAQRADFDRLEGAVDDMAELADAVDLDLELVQEQVNDLQGRLAVAEAKVASLEGIINQHADVIDGLSVDMTALREETASLRPLNDLLYFDDGKIFVDGVDMVFRPGKNEDGSLKSTGPVMVRPPIE
jgi:sigma54-dependent transcription regulator